MMKAETPLPGIGPDDGWRGVSGRRVSDAERLCLKRRYAMRVKHRPGNELRGGFTLVDLVVVVGLAALLVPLTLPALRDASEKAKIDQCLTNLRQLMRATGMYLSDYEDRFSLRTPSGNGICSWIYGGKTSSDWWKAYAGGAFFIPVDKRPLNPYVLGARAQPDAMNGSQIVARTAMPMFQCPSDRVSHQGMFEEGPSCYDDVGTSYQFDLHAMFDVNWWGDADPWTKPGDWDDILRELARSVLASRADTFTWFLEDPMDWGVASWTKIITTGNHGEFGKHSCGYLDGHADYQFRDTRGWCGVGWEAINRAWVVSEYFTPPIHYEPFGTVNDYNCDPPLP